MNKVPPVSEAPRSIMLIDDEPENLNVLETVLSRAGYRLSAFTRGDRALDAARSDPPDLVLLDIRMPDMDGYEVCRRFKLEERLGRIPILFISALSAMESISEGFACGAVDYIMKPFHAAEVLARVRTHIGLREAYDGMALQHAQLQALERHRDAFVHMLVHDMRSPLQVMLGHLELVIKGCSESLNAEDLSSLHEVMNSTQLLSRMASTVIDISRMESEELILRPVAVAVNELFRNACAQSITPSARGRIVEHMAAPCPRVLCDCELSERIISNLLTNALKFSARNSEIALGAEPVPVGVRLWVRSHGVAIPADAQNRIFEKFGVAGQPLDRSHSTTGLGLTFCKQVVESQGGTIGVESGPGQSNTFWFTLPAAEE